MLKVIEVYPGLDLSLQKRLSEYKNNLVRLINSIGLHKDINKAFFTTLDTILDSTEDLEAKKTKLIEIFSNLIDKFQNEEMMEIDNIMKIYGYYSIKDLTLSDIVVSGYNPSMTGHVNANSCFNIFNVRLLIYKSLYESLKKIMEELKIPELGEYNISENVVKMFDFIKSLADKVNKNAKVNLAEQARLAAEAAAAEAAAGAEAARLAKEAAPQAAETPEATSQQSIPLPPIPPADPNRRPQQEQLYNRLGDRQKQANYKNELYNTPGNNEAAGAGAPAAEAPAAEALYNTPGYSSLPSLKPEAR